MWSDTPCSLRASHKFSHLTLSNAFDKSTLTIHTGTSSERVLSSTRFVVSRCSSMRRSARNPCCSSGCPASKVASILPSTKYANVLYNSLTTAIGRKSDVDFAPLVFGNMLNTVCFHVSGTSPVKSTVPNKCNNASNITSGEWWRSSATSPTSSAALFVFNRVIAFLSSAIVQGASVKQGSTIGLPGFPANNCSSISANSNGCGCSGSQRPVP